MKAFFNHSNEKNMLDITKKVKVRSNSAWYDSRKIPSFVYSNEYNVIEAVRDRAVIGKRKNCDRSNKYRVFIQ